VSGWTRGNRLQLLENGEAFFPRVFEAIRHAQAEVLLETFLWFEDVVGRQLMEALVDAAGRGVRVQVTVDGYGSPGFSSDFLERLTDAGVSVHSFDAQPTILRVRTNVLCRLHRKIVVIDSERAFVGGINFTEEHVRSFGVQSKQDYAVEVTGPVVRDIHEYCRFGNDVHAGSWRRRWRYWLRRFPRELKNPQEGAQVLFAIRDNEEHPTDIETMYRVGIGPGFPVMRRGLGGGDTEKEPCAASPSDIRLSRHPQDAHLVAPCSVARAARPADGGCRRLYLAPAISAAFLKSFAKRSNCSSRFSRSRSR